MTRDLGASERLYWIFNQWSPNNVVASCEITGALEPERLQLALRQLQALHPFLQRRVLPDVSGRHPRFVRRGTAPIPLFMVELDVAAGETSEAAIERLIEAELNVRLDATRALAQLRCVRTATGSVLIFTCLHIVADATAAVTALADLLGLYDTPEPRAPLPARPSPELLMPKGHAGLRALPATLLSQLRILREQLRDRPARLPSETALPLDARENCLMRARLSNSQLEALKRACTARDVTLHGLLMAALADSLALELELRQRPRAMLNVGSPLSYRAELEPAPQGELGSYVTTLYVHLDVGQRQDLWSIAHQANQEIARRRQRTEHLALMNLLEWIAPASFARSRRTIEMTDQRGPGNVCLSNIGQVHFPSTVAGMTVERVDWTASLSITGYFLCSVCSTPQGLALDFAYVRRTVSPERARRIVDCMLGKLQQVAEAA